MNYIPTKNKSVAIETAPPCCDGNGECDGQSFKRLGASFAPGDLALLSFSIPAEQWKHKIQMATKSLRLWYVVVASDGEGINRVVTGILSGDAKHVLGSRIHKDSVEQMEPIKFTARDVLGGIVHREAIKKRRVRIAARKNAPRE